MKKKQLADRPSPNMFQNYIITTHCPFRPLLISISDISNYIKVTGVSILQFQ